MEELRGKTSSDSDFLVAMVEQLKEGDKVLDASEIAHQARCYSMEYMEILGNKSSRTANLETTCTRCD
jgi:hypothetical protein